MSLTKDDLTDIRTVILEALEVAVNPRFDSLESKVDKLEGRMDGLEARMLAQESAQRETNHRLTSVEAKLENVDGRLQAIEADVKELYGMVGKVVPASFDKDFAKLSPEQKLHKLHAHLHTLARHMQIEL